MMAGKAIPTLAFNQEVEASKVALDQQDKLFGTIKVSVQTLPSELDEDGNSMEMMDSNSIMAEMDSQDMIGITPFQQECQQLELDIADSVMSYTEKTLTMTSSFLTIPSSVGESRDMLSASASGRVSPVGKDFCGLLMLEVVCAENIPLCTARPNKGGLPSPFAVISFGRKSFKTKCIQRSQDPYWKERVYLPLTEKELNYMASFSLYDYRTLTPTACVGSQSVPCSTFTSNPNLKQRLELDLDYRPDSDGPQQPPPPKLLIKGRFTDLTSLKRIFWGALCKQFDNNENGYLNFVELEMMLSCVCPSLTDDSIRLISGQLGTDRGEANFTFDQVADAMLMMKISNSQVKSGDEVVIVGECPICTKQFECSLTGDDILVHVSICAERNASGKIENTMMGGFLTEEHASRKWLSRIFSFVSYGGYQIGKNNANIFVQDRLTGKVMEEKMPAYIRLGIRLIYQSTGSKADTRMIRKVLHSMTLRQGKKFSSYESRRNIQSFVKFHGLCMEEILDPLDSFRSFNEFFYRKLKPGARVAASMEPNVCLCPADSRLVCYQTIVGATQVWIKGQNFTVAGLLKDSALGTYFDGGSLAVFRLAPQDYHRFHAPFEASVNLIYHIPGAYFTVNPMAIRQRLDVLTENARTVAILDSPTFGKVAYVAVGAMMVGSILMSCEAGDALKRLDEIGYFAFGGSTIVMIFPPNSIRFDELLLENSQECLETLVKVGQVLGYRM